MSTNEEYKPILSNQAERAKRNLIVLSVFVLSFWYVGFVPEKTPIFNMPLDEENLPKVLKILFFLQFYLLIQFLCTAVTDFRYWVGQVWDSQEKPKGIGVYGVNDSEVQVALDQQKSERFFTFFLALSIGSNFVLPSFFGLGAWLILLFAPGSFLFG